jgi:hypothetical protein
VEDVCAIRRHLGSRIRVHERQRLAAVFQGAIFHFGKINSAPANDALFQAGLLGGVPVDKVDLGLW